MRERSNPVRPATDAILVAVSVHQHDDPNDELADSPREFAALASPASELPPGVALATAGRRILRAHLRRSKRRQVEATAPDRGQSVPVPLAPPVSTDTRARLFARH
jgi:hypothetical protein